MSRLNITTACGLYMPFFISFGCHRDPLRAEDETEERKVTQWVCGGARVDADLCSYSTCFSCGHCWPLKEAGLEVGASVAEVSVKMRTFQTLGYD